MRLVHGQFLYVVIEQKLYVIRGLYCEWNTKIWKKIVLSIMFVLNHRGTCMCEGLWGVEKNFIILESKRVGLPHYGCWQKTSDFWIKDKGLYSSEYQHLSLHSNSHREIWRGTDVTYTCSELHYWRGILSLGSKTFIIDSKSDWPSPQKTYDLYTIVNQLFAPEGDTIFIKDCLI